MSLILPLLNQTIDTIYSTTTDGYGDVTTTTLYSSISCRWQEKVGVIVDNQAVERRYSVEACVSPDYTILDSYRIKKGTEIYIIVAIEKAYDLDGKHDHTKLYLS